MPVAAQMRARRSAPAASRRAQTNGFHADGADSRFDRRLAGLLGHAADVFCEKGYAAASMRDLAKACKMSLAGLYHYCDSKEELLFLIQRHTFSTITARTRARLAGV